MSSILVGSTKSGRQEIVGPFFIKVGFGFLKN